MTVSAEDRCRRAFERIRADHALGAWCHLDVERALQDAAESDRRYARNATLSPLDGVLVAVKANIAVQGWPLEGGLGSRKGMIATHDAQIIGRLRAAGAILLGLTAMDEGALGAEGLSLQGPIGHPRDAAYSPGGSSGGSAVALAAEHCTLALGTDTIGSVRIPAALCGVLALKPSSGRLPLHGVLPVHPDFDHLGPMAKDLPLLFAAWTWLTEGRCGPALPALDLRGLPVGYLTGLSDLGTTPEVIERYADDLQRLAAAGAELIPLDVSPDRFELARVRRAVFTLCEWELAQTHADTLRDQPESFSDKFRALLNYGAALSEAKQLALAELIVRFREQWLAHTSGLAAVVAPVTPIDKFRHDAPAPVNIADLTVIATAARLPALVTASALQIIVPVGEESRAFSLAAALDQRLA